MTTDIATAVVNALPLADACTPVCAEFRAGMTIAEVLGAHAATALEVRCGGEVVPRALWARVRPRAGTFLHITLYPQGGGARKVLSIVAIAVISYFTLGGGAGWIATTFNVSGAAASAIGAGLFIAGALAVNALIPPPMPKGIGGGQQDPFQQLQSITGTSNSANPYGVIPCVVGTYRFYPCHAALPYTEISGDDQYLRMLLDLGYGDLDISDIQIGDSPLSSFQDVEYEVTTTPTLFTQDIYEASVAATVTAANDTATRTTQTNTTEISIDLVFSQGLYGINSDGKTVAGSTSFSIQYAAAGSGSWQSVASASGVTSTNGLAASGSVSSTARKVLRCGLRWKVPKGQYDVRVTRGATTWPGAEANAKIGDCVWTVLRSVSPQNPSTSGTLKLAMRIKASDQLNGVVQNLSVLAAQKIPAWNKTTQAWSVDAESQNPAWIFAWLLTRCPAVARRLADSRLDLDDIADWAAECDTKGYKVSFVMDSARAFSDVLRDVLACGRATMGMRNGRYTAWRDNAQTVPVQMFTPKNSSGFKYERAFGDPPHALRCKFVNPEAGYKQDYVTVYASGYTSANATRFEELDLGPVVDPAAAWRLGMYHLAVIYNRACTYTFSVDIAQLPLERGDMVTRGEDVTGWGTAFGRVVAVNGATLTLDETVTLAPGKTYQVRVITLSGGALTQPVATVTNAAGTYTTLTLAAPLACAAGDSWLLGEVTNSAVNLLIRQITPDTDMGAELVCVDAAPAVWEADSGTPPAFVSSITNTMWCGAPDPPTLNLIVTGSNNDAGTFNQGGGLSIPPQGGILRGIGGGGGGRNGLPPLRQL